MLKITAEEVNFLIYQYLEETGYKHSAFAFKFEASLTKSAYNESRVPPGLLLMYLEKALLLLQMETHLNKDDDEVIVCNQPFSLLNPHACDYIPISAIKNPADDISKRPPPLIGNPSLRISEIPSGQPTTPANLTGSQLMSKLNNPISTNIIQKTPNKNSSNLNEDTKQNNDSLNQIQKQQTLDSNIQRICNETPIALQKSILLSHADNTETISKALRLLSAHEDKVYCLAWHPQKRILASSSRDSTAKLWILNDVIENKMEMTDLAKNRSHLPQIINHRSLSHKSEEKKSNATKKDVTCVNWCSTKNMLVTGSSDGLARIWDEEGIINSCNINLK